MSTRAYQTHWHRHPAVRSGDQLTFGERAADAMRRGMGSWPFVFCFFGVMIGWAVANTIVISRSLGSSEFDPYPYILLNLFLSMLAGVQAAALLIAAKRADAISSELAMHDYQTDQAAKHELDTQTTLLNEMHSNTQDIKALSEALHRHLVASGQQAQHDAPRSTDQQQ